MSHALHTCSVPGCSIELPTHVLMCRTHWRRVPYPFRSQVWAAWEQWQYGKITLAELRTVQDQATNSVVSKGGAA